MPDRRPISAIVAAAGAVLLVASTWLAAPLGAVETAGELFVDLDAADPTAGTGLWKNRGTLGEFVGIGDPVKAIRAGAPAVILNEIETFQAYQAQFLSPGGIVGPDPTSTVEVWAYDDIIPLEGTLVAWGKRGGPDGSNMSFNLGTDPVSGAVGRWGPASLGWGEIPLLSQWHHLAMTCDGTTTRIFVDGVETNSRTLTTGSVDIHRDSRITIGAQINSDGFSLDFDETYGSLAIGRVRIHDGVLSPEAVRKNHDEERPAFPFDPIAPTFVDAPAADAVFRGEATYRREVRTTGFPPPVLAAVEPAGAGIAADGVFSWDLPDPAPASFKVTLRATNPGGSVDATWTVTVKDSPEGIEKAGTLLVDLDAADPTAGTSVWKNQGTAGPFEPVGEPLAGEVAGARAVTFNAGGTDDAYRSVAAAPGGIIGVNPSFSVEVWTHNPRLAKEEIVVAWGRPGVQGGASVSVLHGYGDLSGAIGDGPQTLGWRKVPEAGAWRHLAATFDGRTLRIYADGVETNRKVLGAGALDIDILRKIVIAAGNASEGFGLEFGDRKGSLSIGRVRVHDGALSPFGVLNNYRLERPSFPLPPPVAAALLTAAPVHRYGFAEGTGDSIGGADGQALGGAAIEGGRAVFPNDGVRRSDGSGVSPPAPPPGAYIDLPNGIVSALGNSATFEAWVTWTGPFGSTGQRIFDFGTSAGGENASEITPDRAYIYLTPRSADGSLRIGLQSPAPPYEQRTLDGSTLEPGTAHHVAVTWEGESARMALFLDGRKVDEDFAHLVPSNLEDVNNWLGRSQGPDPLFAGSIDELRLYSYALTEGQVLGNFQRGPEVVAVEGSEPSFRRGDADGSGVLDLTDPIHVLSHLFLAGEGPPCRDAADADDSGQIDLTDAIFSLSYLYLGGPAPPAPGPLACGIDPTAEDPDLGRATSCP